MLKQIEIFANEFLEKTSDKKEIVIVSHFDTDGITSAAIIGNCLKKLDKNFSFKIIKGLERKFIEELPKNKNLLFLDLASNNLSDFLFFENNVFIIDHHEVQDNVSLPKNIHLLNVHKLENSEEMSNSCLSYLFTKALIKKSDQENACLAIVGLVGDIMEKNIGPITNSIIKEGNIIMKKGILLYPSTRPLNKALEYCSNPFIPGITGDPTGACSLLREAEIDFSKTGYKSLIELNEEEMKKLVTLIALRMPDAEEMQRFIGNIFLIKFFNQLEDARELSALINACSRMGHSNISLLMCMGNQSAKQKAEKIYIKYKQTIIGALKHISTNPKIQGKQYVIMNAKDKIQDTIIGTIASILSMSAIYKEGTIIITMAYNQDKIKVSSRIAGTKRQENSGRNLKEIMDEITDLFGGESGGHKFAAGCIISKEKEEAFIEFIKRKLDVELVKI